MKIIIDFNYKRNTIIYSSKSLFILQFPPHAKFYSISIKWTRSVLEVTWFVISCVFERFSELKKLLKCVRFLSSNYPKVLTILFLKLNLARFLKEALKTKVIFEKDLPVPKICPMYQSNFMEESTFFKSSLRMAKNLSLRLAGFPFSYRFLSSSYALSIWLMISSAFLSASYFLLL